MAGAKRGGRGGEKSAKEEKGKGASPLPSPLPPTALPFSLFPYPLPLSTPATQANFHLEEGETMLARGNENFRAPGENRTRDLPNPVIPGKQTGTSWREF